MPEFRTTADVANRALQHIGGQLLDPALGLSETSKRASEINNCIGKLRRAELERNVWTFATRRVVLRAIDTTTMLLAPAAWVSTVTYFVGSIVADGNGDLWISQIPNNLGNDPTTTTAWQPYFGTLTVVPFDTTGTTAYFAGELVYTAAGDGKNRVYISLISGNSDTPGTPSAWSATTTYRKNDVVTFSSVAYMSLIDLNLNQEPDLAPALFNIATTYSAGQKVGGSDGVIYQSVGSGNVGHDPVSDGGVHWTNTGVLNPWTTVFVGGTGSVNWRQIGGAEFPNGVGLSELSIMYPIGAGPLMQTITLNIYKLPNNFLKPCSQDPKAGAISFLGAPGGLAYKDWLFEGGFLVTKEFNPITLRFVADITDVSLMHTQFCEGWAAKIGEETCEAITQSTTKLQNCRVAYQDAMGRAKLSNAIEAGAEEPPVDDYISCRY